MTKRSECAAFENNVPKAGADATSSTLLALN